MNRKDTNMAKLWYEELKRLRDRTTEKEPLPSAPHQFITDFFFQRDVGLRSESRAEELGLKSEEVNGATARPKFRKWFPVSSPSSSAINTMIDCLFLVD